MPRPAPWTIDSTAFRLPIYNIKVKIYEKRQKRY
jgi:hypothetical protein